MENPIRRVETRKTCSSRRVGTPRDEKCIARENFPLGVKCTHAPSDYITRNSRVCIPLKSAEFYNTKRSPVDKLQLRACILFIKTRTRTRTRGSIFYRVQHVARKISSNRAVCVIYTRPRGVYAQPFVRNLLPDLCAFL